LVSWWVLIGTRSPPRAGPGRIGGVLWTTAAGGPAAMGRATCGAQVPAVNSSGTSRITARAWARFQASR